MRSGVEACRLERTPHVRERLGRRRREVQLRTAEQTVHVIAAEPDAFHVKRRHGPGQRFAFLDQRAAQIALGLLPNEGNEILDSGFGRFFIIRGRHFITL